MAKSSAKATTEKKEAASKATQAKRRELLELRLRCKFVDELAKQYSNERKELRARIDALSKEVGSSDETTAEEG